MGDVTTKVFVAGLIIGMALMAIILRTTLREKRKEDDAD